MLILFFVITCLSWMASSETLETIKGDSSHIELRLVLNMEVEAGEPRRLRSVFVERPLGQALEVFRHDQYNPDLPSVIIIHGFHGSADKLNPNLHALIANNYRQRYNLFALNMPLYLDWTAGNLWYLLPALRAKYGGEAVGELLNQAIGLGLVSADRLHLVGFSLGAQMAGYIARTVRGEVHSILGLDPAGPGFDTKLVQYNLLMTHVSKADARYVHMYHTNSNTFGSTQRVATADFTFNNGWHQPGCITSILIMCSHRRVMVLFSAIINNPHQFRAVSCPSYWDFRHCHCRDRPVIPLVFPPDPSANGTYYLTTSSRQPYGEAALGSMCAKDRLDRLIQEGVITPKPAVSFYEALRRLRPSAMFWGSPSHKRKPTHMSWGNGTVVGDYDHSPGRPLEVVEVAPPPAADSEADKEDGESLVAQGKDATAANIIQTVIAQNLD